MRTFSSAAQAVIDSGTIKFIFLIKLGFSSTYYLSSHHRDTVYEGNTYLSDGGLFEFDSPKFSSVVDRESYKIVIADLTDNLAAEFRLNVVGKSIDVKVALLDVNGEPLLAPADIISAYSGFVDAPSIEADFETKLAILEGTSPMSDLDMVRSFITSKAGMDQKSSDDTSFDEIFKNNQITVKWGKI
jgi:hypothetical protein